MKSGLAESSAYWGIRILTAMIRLLPKRAAYAVGKAAGRIYFCFSGRRRFAYADLKSAFAARYSAKERWKIARRHYEHIGQSFIEMIHFAEVTETNVQKEFDIQDLHHADEADKGKKGLIYLTAHLGNWELLVTLADAYGKPMHALARMQKLSKLNSLLNDFRKKRGSKVTTKGMGLRDLIRALRKGERIGVLGDQSAGKHHGFILPFFGRKTSVPAGAFELAMRTGAVILPSFVTREENGRHKVHLGKPYQCETADAALSHMKDYLRTLEALIEKYPEQWLWAKKRWKYSWTKRLLILSDGKAGHFKQSQAVAQVFYSIHDQYGRPGMEYPTQIVEVRYKSRLAKNLFMVFAAFFHPWAQGRLNWLNLFLEKETVEALNGISCDFVISAGSGLVPLNLCIARENMAKSVVCMKPPFPYNLNRYGLVIVPAHDEGCIPRESVRMLLTPSISLENDVDTDDLRHELRDESSVRIGVFLGGPSHGYTVDEKSAEILFDSLQASAAAYGDFIVTTSRRTPSSVNGILESRKESYPACQLFVNAEKDRRSGVVEAMLPLIETAVVTEDSISMISEALRAKKKVIVLSWGSKERLAKKHRRFLKRLESTGAILRCAAGDIGGALGSVSAAKAGEIAERDEKVLRKKLQEIL